MDRIKVLVVDDSIQFRWALMEALVHEESLEIVDEASDGDEAEEKARVLKPNVVLMDLYMPNRNGVETTRQLQAEMPDINILMLTVSESEADLVDALKAGARGYLLKNESQEQIVQAIHYVARGGLLVSPSMATKLLAEFRTQEPAAPGVAADTQANFPAEAEVATEEEEAKAMVGQAHDELSGDTRESHQEVVESPGPMGAAAPEDRVSNVSLVLPPPLEPTTVLRLHRWLKEVAKGDVGKITGSLGGDTVMTVGFREPVPLLQMLSELPDVTAVAEEPYPRETVTSQEGLASPSEQVPGAQQPAHRRFRVALKAR